MRSTWCTVTSLKIDVTNCFTSHLCAKTQRGLVLGAVGTYCCHARAGQLHVYNSTVACLKQAQLHYMYTTSHANTSTHTRTHACTHAQDNTTLRTTYTSLLHDTVQLIAELRHFTAMTGERLLGILRGTGIRKAYIIHNLEPHRSQGH